MRWCNVVVVLKAMPIFVFFNKLVIFLIFGLWKVNVVLIFFSFLLVFLLLTLCSICRLSFSSRCCGKLLFLTTDCIISHSVYFLSGLRDKECILVMWNVKAAIFCWSTFKYFIILIVSKYYILCVSWIMKCLIHFNIILSSTCRPSKWCLSL